YKKARSELKKRSTDTLRLQKKVGRKGVAGRNADLQKALQEVNERKSILEEAEKKALRAALVEERSRYCVFVTFLKPVVVSWYRVRTWFISLAIGPPRISFSRGFPWRSNVAMLPLCWVHCHMLVGWIKSVIYEF
ncbi:hypothetical protein WDU94_014187, partial [Cyamophila willieti]